MKLIKVGDFVINLAEVTHIEFKTRFQESKYDNADYRYAVLHLKGFQGRIFSGEMNVDNYADNDPLSEQIVYLFREEAEALESYLNHSTLVDVLTV